MWSLPVARIPGAAALSESAAKHGRVGSCLAIGLLMGLLPCGMSYAAFARALPAGSIWTGALLVLAFGLGTVPGLLLMGTVASGIARKYRRTSDTISGVIMLIMAASMGFKTLSKFF